MILKFQLCFVCLFQALVLNAQIEIPRYSVYELSFQGATYSITDNPVRDIYLITTWQHISTDSTLKIYGFFDGNGEGNSEGNIFKVRFCPTQTGVWKLTDVESNDELLNNLKEGLTFNCVYSDLKGFWFPDPKSHNRWYQRSNGEHPYIIGNTFYTFLSEYHKGKPSGGNIKSDVLGNAAYLNKLRFAVTGDIFPNPIEKPFIDNEGKPTDNANYSHRPNVKWFKERVDLTVNLCYEKDVIADIILNGPDSEMSRTALMPKANNEDFTPYIKYIAARYGSFPNVWICLSNEYDIKEPRISAQKVVEIGEYMKEVLPYSTPLSVHGDQGNWKNQLNIANWNDHIIIQNKIKYLNTAADYNNLNYWIGGAKPVFNDELAYEGNGDRWTEEDVLEAVLGAFIGGGYASSGYKPARKEGHYFAGNFNPKDHTAIDNLLWFRQAIDQNIKFWKMQPTYITEATYKDDVDASRSSIFYQLDKDFRVIEWEEHQYVLATNKAKEHILAYLTEGEWEVKLFDVIAKKEKLIGENLSGIFEFESPNSRSAFFVFTKVED